VGNVIETPSTRAISKSGKCSAALLIAAVSEAAVHLLVVAPENYS
jgi:hypothetical protein